MKKNTNRILSLALALYMVMYACGFTAYAIEPDKTFEKNVMEASTEDEGISTCGTLSGYGQATVSAVSSGSFTFEVDGDYSTAAGMTLKTSSSSSGGTVYLTIQKPNGDYYKNNLFFEANEENFYQMYFVYGALIPYTIQSWQIPRLPSNVGFMLN